MPTVQNPAGYFTAAAPVLSDDGTQFWFPEAPNLTFDASHGLPGQYATATDAQASNGGGLYQAGRWFYNGAEQAQLDPSQYGIIHLGGWPVEMALPDVPTGVGGFNLDGVASLSSFFMNPQGTALVTFADVLNALWSLKGGTLLGVVLYEYRWPQTALGVGSLSLFQPGLTYELVLITRTDPVAQAQWFRPAQAQTTGGSGGSGTPNVGGVDALAFFGTIIGLLALAATTPIDVGVGSAVAAGVVALLAVDGLMHGNVLSTLRSLWSEFIGGAKSFATAPITAGTESVLVIAAAGVGLALFLGLSEKSGAQYDVGGAAKLLGAGGGIAEQGVRASQDIIKTELGVAGGVVQQSRMAAQQRGALAVAQERTRAEQTKGQSAVEVARIKAAAKAGS